MLVYSLSWKLCFLFILFSYPHVIPSCFSKRSSFLGTDFHFWSWLGLTRNQNVKSWMNGNKSPYLIWFNGKHAMKLWCKSLWFQLCFYFFKSKSTIGNRGRSLMQIIKTSNKVWTFCDMYCRFVQDHHMKHYSFLN